VIVLTPEGTLSPMGMIPSRKKLRVAGVFTLGLIEFDSTYGFVSLDVAKRMLSKDQVDFLQLRVDDIYQAPAIARQVSARLGDQYFTQDWAEMNRSLFSALTLEKIAVSLAIGLIVMVAALNIIASLILLVMEKHRDIAILKTMGASARSVTVVFLLQGLIIGIVGTTVGAAAGVGRLEGVRSIPADSRADRYLPGVAPAVHGAAARLPHRGPGRRARVFRGDDLPVAAGGQARSCSSATL
jgi:lipoprotein-releasing system permease protein